LAFPFDFGGAIFFVTEKGEGAEAEGKEKEGKGPAARGIGIGGLAG
jgi:hypothetical protein